MFLQIQEDMFTETNETTIVCKWFVKSCSVICFIKCGDNVRIDKEIFKAEVLSVSPLSKGMRKTSSSKPQL